MSIRQQSYLVWPHTACPPALQTAVGTPRPALTLDTLDVARCAWGEILQTAPRSTALATFFDDLLASGPDLVWRGTGPGLGKEMRRAFSGMFGRFFARAYLSLFHDFSWFHPIDGDHVFLSPRWMITRYPGAKRDMPDWICARPGALALGEAKGSHQASGAVAGGRPGPIKTAIEQIRGTLILRGTPNPSGPMTWTPRSVKGWAVMSRWGIEHGPRSPYLYAYDPSTEGEELTPEETDDLVQAVAQSHIFLTARGLGLLKSDQEGVITPASRRRVRLAGDDDAKRGFLGAIITPFGLLDLDLDRAKALAALLPNPDLVRFVGLDEQMFNAHLRHQPLQPLHRQVIGDLTMVGSDGLVVAPIEQIGDITEVPTEG
ncbi:hypothetical protein PX554_26095 [Sphingomonas sp. H39-1-10]|uniref:hypothetical protein n=1 Tax=Sphingomonas pollutisoli TaxID=3030829 RepID=UPI0023B9FAC1|nr:hypothetical protein [Sphingomonas pollutisoli]MDF0491590.1 hypothetical protein [Sphingomonas pollutisoli]